ncbi:domain of Kin17 curved DNA-binding protein-domain-containing protein [Chaetomidium leptoderma]|uniref:Domain of Kin17 curved DNA-binding protein-domain-containing protein n=1 Tax=Chaetomidium leptoderma TaxID=669021 RepID=A0AAN6VLF1_9PEZI|nr:domain of Kin17 curved DNA-binding protein-domain-containing protein [Chaetomidium leptoderma]
MGKAEPGSTKYLANKMKSKGLTRLRWYCQICEKACRDENAFKMHCQSESHMRRALDAGQNFKSVQEDYSKQFLQEFVTLLKTAHGEKSIHANKFYQEIIARKDHVHLNSTRWHSLTDFVKHISKEGIVRAEEKDDGVFIAWIDDSPDAMKRRDAVRRKEMQDKGDEEREQMLLREQIKRAQRDAEARGVVGGEDGEGEEAEGRGELKPEDGERIKLIFGAKPAAKKSGTPEEGSMTPTPSTKEEGGASEGSNGEAKKEEDESKPAETTPAPLKPVSLKFGAKPQAKNVFKNAFAGAPKKVMAAQPKKMSEAERIMKEELERKRTRAAGGGPPHKRPRF